MRILIEEYRYKALDVRETIYGLDVLEDIEGYVSVNYVGYYFNSHPQVYDCVFILPKVLLEVKDGEELVFGQYRPEEIICVNENSLLTFRYGYIALLWCFITTNETTLPLFTTRR